VVKCIGTVQKVLADAFERSRRQELELHVAVTGEDQNVRKFDYRPPRDRSYKKLVDPRLVAMREKLTHRRKASAYTPNGLRLWSLCSASSKGS
jgi:hypothetical protein